MSAPATPTASPTHVLRGSLESWRAPQETRDDATEIVVECREEMRRLWSDRCALFSWLYFFVGVADGVCAQGRARCAGEGGRAASRGHAGIVSLSLAVFAPTDGRPLSFLNDVDRIAARGYEPSDGTFPSPLPHALLPCPLSPPRTTANPHFSPCHDPSPTTSTNHPIADDVIRARLRTMGVQEHRFTFERGLDSGREWRVYDVGGARGQVRARPAPAYISCSQADAARASSQRSTSPSSPRHSRALMRGPCSVLVVFLR